MSRRLAGAVAIAITASLSPAYAASNLIVVVAKNTAILTFEQDQSLRLDLKPFSTAGAITRAKILSNTTRGNVMYVVVDVEGPTILNGRSGYCGGGEEANLIWLKISATKVLDVRSVLYYSCTFTIEYTNPPRQEKQTWRVEFDSFSEERTFVWSYDEKAPEQGVSVVSRPRSR